MLFYILAVKLPYLAMYLKVERQSISWYLVFSLSIKDLLHDWRVASALMLSIVSVVTPLLLLFGLKTGVVATLQEILIKDPRNLEVIIFENTSLPNAWFDKYRADTKQVRFIIPKTRTSNTMIDVENQDNYRLNRVELIPTAPGDPLLPSDLNPPSQTLDTLLTYAASTQLDLRQGDQLNVWFKRKLDGIEQHESIPLNIIGIVPDASFSRPALFVNLSFLEALEDYRDGYAVPRLSILLNKDKTSEVTEVFDNFHFATKSTPIFSFLIEPNTEFSKSHEQCVELDHKFDKTPVKPPKSLLNQGKSRNSPRSSYASARLYAQTPENVDTLATQLRHSGIDVRTRSEDIYRLQAADRLLSQVLGLIAIISLAGGYLAFGGAIWITIERKRHSLALLRLLGLCGRQIIGFCLFQATVLGSIAFIISYGLYWLGSNLLNHYGANLFLELLNADINGILLCQLSLKEGFMAAAATLLFTLFASLLGAVHAKSFQAAECLREI
ncbi:MAG: hypothetical protein WAW41_10930 [Methylobacter sp.]